MNWKAFTKYWVLERSVIEFVYRDHFNSWTNLIPYFSVLFPHRRTTTVSLETNPFIQFLKNSYSIFIADACKVMQGMQMVFEL